MKITFKKSKSIEHNFYGNQYVDLKIKRLSRIKPTVKPSGFQFKGYKEVAFICLLLIPVCYFGHMAASNSLPCYDSNATVKCISPIASNAYANTIKTQPEVSIAPSPIKDEIKQVFGNDADKAFKLLSCENGRLNPNAVNTAGNYPAGSRDIGVFQVNEYWQKVNAKFLFNPAINIRIAYQIYKDDGYSFHMWTCGRKLGL